MEGLQRVTFRFGRDAEVRYLQRVPKRGDLVTHGRALWVVFDVSADAVGATVICELPTGNGRGLAHVA
jgi:hypothetical protein